MTILLYLFRGKVLIPTLARTEAGFFLSLEPIEAVSASDVEALQQSLTRVVIRGNPSTPTPPGGKAFPKDPILKHAGLKSWTAFQEDAQLWTIDVKEQSFEIIPNRPREDRGFEEDSARKEILPGNIGVEGLARRMAEIVRQKTIAQS